MNREIVVETAKAAPAVAATTAAVITDWSLNHWVAIASIAFICLQAAHLVWKWRQEAKDLLRKKE